MMASTWKVIHARTPHRCDERRSGCRKMIQPGQVYMREVFFPNDVVDEISVFLVCDLCMDSRQGEH
jgi:hypothetical protein